MELSKMVWSLVTIFLFLSLFIFQDVPRDLAESFSTEMKEINFIFGKGVIGFNAVSREAVETI